MKKKIKFLVEVDEDIDNKMKKDVERLKSQGINYSKNKIINELLEVKYK